MAEANLLQLRVSATVCHTLVWRTSLKLARFTTTPVNVAN